ncbi:relaxase/mobilization nuclease [Streptomyces sp. NPDC093589]|uniref:relaxase/mobilization nuclease n=1 Tax=Streptomyces sp. NPDC093589 TaxID=3366043 RepID=UPI00382CC9C5
MIPRVHPRAIDVTEALTEALGRPVSDQEGLTGHTVVAYWTELGSSTQDDEQDSWTSAQWAQHLQDPLLDAPYAASPQGDQCAIFHLDVRLHPDDRDLSGAEWAEAAHRLARAAGLQKPGDRIGCHWIAVQGKPGRLDLIANLVRSDGTWQRQPIDLPRRLSDQARRIEADLQLRSPARHDLRAKSLASTAPEAVSAAGQIAQVLSQLSDERTGPLATVRGLVEHTSHRLGGLPQPYGSEAGHRLQWAARRLHGIQRDLDHTATILLEHARLTPATPPGPAVQPAPIAGRIR